MLLNVVISFLLYKLKVEQANAAEKADRYTSV